MSDDLAISVQNVSKAYRIWESPASRLASPLWETAADLMPKYSGVAMRLHRRAARHYRDFWALQEISFEVKRGEAIGIVGRNGSGKSTLLQIIAGTLQPTTGQVRVNGRVAALLELGSGFTPEFTGRENVFLNATVLGLTKTEINQRYDSICAFADIGDFVDQPVKTYSSGMLMRLAFAVLAHVNADILIIDEALAVGDVFFVQKCMRFIREFQERGTLLLVTHDTSAVTSLCQRAIWLHHGRCEGLGSAKTISEEYLRATYAEKQGVVLFKEKKSAMSVDHCNRGPATDQRHDYINHSNLRNDIKVFDFNPNSAAFGAGGASIEQVHLVDRRSHTPIAYVVGGEQVTLSIIAQAHIALDRPILGFFLKNSLGQHLFGDNTYLTHLDAPCPVRAGEFIKAHFCFQMPYLPSGDYMVCAAIANGTQEEHIQHHWMHEALAFRSHVSHVVGGLIGLPMLEIGLSYDPVEAPYSDS